MSVGIAGVGVYAPTSRLSTDEIAETWGNVNAPGIEATAVPAADEDVLTMGYEAAQRALNATGTNPDDVTTLIFATTNPPLAEETLLPHLGEMLALPDDSELELHTGSIAAGLVALKAGLRAVDDGTALVVASDAPRGNPDTAIEQGAGAGATAFVLTVGAPAKVTDWASYSEPSSGTRFRRRGAQVTEGLGITAFDRDAFRTVVTGALDQLTYDPETIGAAAVQATNGRLPYRITDALPVSNENLAQYTTVHNIGDTGVASVPLSLACALADGISDILGIAVGSEATAEAVTIAVHDTVPTIIDLGGTSDLEYDEYLRQQGELSKRKPEGGGGYVSIPTWHRSSAQRYRLEAGRCSVCGELNLPPRGACSYCHKLAEYAPVRLDRTGVVEAVSVISQGGAPPEFSELQGRSGAYVTGIVAFDSPEGDSASIPAMFVETDPDDVTVGDGVEMTIRRIYAQEGVPRYGFKVKPQN
ncbi:zinc ribbon domain-containing protein [Haladaptatus sp. DFWS20]|uniref:zinc ribbon domain-containing protein n=1 Tax=Haladaptatus sp. DFWS20 TaxID=3403467 RepID=UPI003EBCBFEA